MRDERGSDDERDPEEAPRLTPGLAIWLCISGSLLCFVSTSMLAGIDPERPPPAIFGIGMLVGYGAAFVLAKPFVEDPPGPALGFVRAAPHTWIAALLLIPSALVLSELENVVATVIPRPELPDRGGEARANWLELAQIGLVYIVVAPLVSETFMRGLIHPRLEPHWGSRGTVFGVALLTCLTSIPFLFSPTQLVVTFGLASLLGLLRRASGSILPGLLLSMGYGVLQTLGARELLGIEGFDRVDAGAHTPLSVLAAPAMMMGIALALCRRPALRPLEPSSKRSDTADFREH